MTAVIETVIFCDSGLGVCPGATFCDGDARHLSAAQQRASYKDNADPTGRWYFFKGKDYCPTCVKALRIPDRV